MPDAVGASGAARRAAQAMAHLQVAEARGCFSAKMPGANKTTPPSRKSLICDIDSGRN